MSDTDFYLSNILPTYERFENALDLESATMHRRLTSGYTQALQGTAWRHQPDVTDQEELIRLLNLRHSVDRFEARPELRSWR